MYKIEITGDTLSELAGKAMSLAVKLNSGAATEPAAREYTQPVTSITRTEQVMPEAPVADAPALSFEQDVAPVVLRAVATKTKAFVEGVMSDFGVARASQLDASRWAELIDRLESPF